MRAKIPVSNIGEVQERDILKSSGSVLYDGTGRICTIVKPNTSFDDRGDTASLRMSRLFGGQWKDYNEHYIIQVAGCPLDCWYCYVDNLKPNRWMDADGVADNFYAHWRQAHRCGLDEINVLHLMGGAPGRYPEFWRELRKSMDGQGEFTNKVLFSDVVFVENYFYRVKPWEYLDMHHFLVTGCLKGTNRQNFLENTGKDLFDQAMEELEHYAVYPNFYLSLINYDEKDLPKIFSVIPKEKIDLLKVVDYEVTKLRQASEGKKKLLKKKEKKK